MKKILNDKKSNIIVAYGFNVLFILLGFILMEDYCDYLVYSYLAVSAIYIIFWVLAYFKTYIPWQVYLHFCIGIAVQIILNIFHIIPEDSGFFSGLVQAFYIFFLLVQVVIMGLINLIKFIKCKIKAKRN